VAEADLARRDWAVSPAARRCRSERGLWQPDSVPGPCGSTQCWRRKSRPFRAADRAGRFLYRYLDGLAARSPLTTPPLARALSQDGRGQSFGGTASLQLAPWHNLSGSVSYTLSRAERQDAPSLPFRLADFDQPQILQVRARYVLFGFGIGLRLRYTSGLPRTEVIDSYYSARDDQFQPVFGAHNGVRLPDFVALDAQLDRTFPLRSGVALAIWLDVQNLTNRKNAEELVYRYDFREHDYITGLPTVAVLGARLSYF
jgi:hypothetical protein